MSDIEIIKLVFGILLSCGAGVLILLAFLLFYKYLVQEQACTAVTKGIVKRYTAASYGGRGSGVHLPVVAYMADGKEYKIVGPNYRVYITKTKSAPVMSNGMNFREENRAMIIERTANSFVRVYKNPMASLYPINSQVDVYYCPYKPKLAYVERYCNNKWAFWLMFLTGIAVFAIDILILVLL